MRNLIFLLPFFLSFVEAKAACSNWEKWSDLLSGAETARKAKKDVDVEILIRDLKNSLPPNLTPSEQENFYKKIRAQFKKRTEREVQKSRLKVKADALNGDSRAAQTARIIDLKSKTRKPKYTEQSHVEGKDFRGGGPGNTSVMPPDAFSAYSYAVPDPANPKQTWWSCVKKGKKLEYYRYQYNSKNADEIHWNGSNAPGPLTIPNDKIPQEVKTWFEPRFFRNK